MHRLRVGRWWLAAAAFGLACGRPPSGQLALTVVDDAGDTVSIGHPAERIVSLIPAATELLFAIGAGPAVVGRTAWCDAPVEALAVPSVGDGLDPNVEAVLRAAPDLVVLYPSARTATAAARLRQLGVAAVQLRTDRLEDLGRASRVLGRLAGREEPAARLTQAMDSALAALPGNDRDGPTVLLVVWDQPPMTVGRGSFLHEVIELAGGRNLFGDLEQPSATVSLEAILQRDPDVVLAIGERASFTERPEWQAVPAVRQGRILSVQGSEFLRPTPRAPGAVTTLRRLLDSVTAR